MSAADAGEAGMVDALEADFRIGLRERDGRLPTFFIIGAMKGGTTSLYHYLREHPAVFMPPFKALEFFAGGPQWERGVEWYRRQFAPAPAGASVLGEASNVYAKYPRYPGVPERIATLIPDARSVYLVRDPIERIRSHHQTRAAEGTERAPLEEAVLSNPIYLDYSRYAMQLDRYLACFPREQLLVLRSEDLRHDRAATLARVYAFLGADPTFRPPSIDREFYRTTDRATHSPVPVWLRKALKTHLPGARRAKELENTVVAALRRARGRREGPARAEVSPALRARLTELLAEDVVRLRDVLGPGFDGWGIA